MTEPDTDTAAAARSRNARLGGLTRAARTDGREISRPAREGLAKTFEPGSDYRCPVCGGPHAAGKFRDPVQQARAIAAARSMHYTRLRALRDKASDTARHAAEVAGLLDAELADAE
jgi:hypothetical protein